MFGRPPKPGSRKATAKFNAIVDSQREREEQVRSDSARQRDAEWDKYALDHPGAEKVFRGSPAPGETMGSLQEHPEFKRLDAEHRGRVKEYAQAALDSTNKAYRDINGIKDTNRELLPTPRGTALNETHKRVLNSQQFGKLPEYGENY